MSFSKRPGTDAVCYIKPLDSLKGWNDHFFWVDTFACPALFSWHTGKSVSRNGVPKSSEFNAKHDATLVAYPALFHKYLKPFLCLIGMSHMDLLSFIQTADPTKVRVGERERDKGEPKLLETTVGRVVPGGLYYNDCCQVKLMLLVSAVQKVKTVSVNISVVVYKLRLPQVVSAAKLPILNPNEFDLWKMRIKQYFLMTDYSLWEVILNGDSPAPTRVIKGVVQPVAPTTTKQRLARKNELKARGTFLMALPNKHQLKFNIHKDAKTLMEAIVKSTNEPISAATSVSAVSAKIPFSALLNVDTLSNVVIYSFFSSQYNSLQLDNDDLKQIDADDLEEMDLKWQMAMSPTDTRRNGAAEPQRRNVPIETSTSNALVSQCDGVGSYDWSFQVEEEPTNYALMAYTSSSSSSSDNESDESLPPSIIYDRYQSRDGYHAVPPPYTGTFMPLKPDLVFYNAPNDNETVHTAFNVELCPTKPETNFSPTNSPLAPIIKDWVSDSEEDFEATIPQNAPSFVQPNKQVKTPRSSIKPVETSILAANHKIAIPKPKSQGNNKNRKECFVCKSLDHLIKDLLTKSMFVSLIAARPVTAVVLKLHVTRPRQAKTVVTKPYSPPRRHINRSPSLKSSNFPLRVTAAKAPMMCDKKNSVLFTDTECLVLSLEFKLPDENQNTRIGFMKPFGCLVTILNTLDSLGKFDGKVDEGFLVGYSNTRIGFMKPFGCLVTILNTLDSLGKFDGKVDEGFLVGKPEFEVYVSPSSSAQSKKHDDETKREAKGKSPVESSTGYRNLSAEFKDFFDNSINEVNVVDMPELEDITYSDDEEDVGAEADFTNLETSITVSSIPTTRVHKDHPVTQIIGDLSSATQTRRYTQEEGIDYEEVFALVARIETMRLFLGYASFMGFTVYQMDVKSAFLYGTIEKEVYVCQPLRFEDPDHSNKVYKVVKALYGLHQAPRAWYETLANYLLENGFHRGKIGQTLFIKRQKGDILLVQIYVDDIIFGYTNKDLCKAFEKLIKDKFQISSMGELTFFLGLQVALSGMESLKKMLHVTNILSAG
nr:putative ribonuclease H-like domain-containing protein [Tanacetum cinerariifolium]